EKARVDVDDASSAAEIAAAVDARDDPEALVLDGILDEEVAGALGSLPEEFRSAVVLVDLQDLTYEESARVLDCPVGTVRSRLSRGRRLLAKGLRPYALRRGILRRPG
ncbi:MAG: sigma factor-like helix-turn-helix DNA-binding protein, partial [Candidatus Binatia bacterium]